MNDISNIIRDWWKELEQFFQKIPALNMRQYSVSEGRLRLVKNVYCKSGQSPHPHFFALENTVLENDLEI